MSNDPAAAAAAASGSSTPAPRVSHPLHDLPLAPPYVVPAKEDDETTLHLMRAGKPYFAGDAYLDKLRMHALALLQKGNAELDMTRRMAMWRQLLDLRPGPRGRCFIAAPFLCEYVSRDCRFTPNPRLPLLCPSLQPRPRTPGWWTAWIAAS